MKFVLLSIIVIALALIDKLGACDSGYPTGTNYSNPIVSKWTTKNYTFTYTWTTEANYPISLRIDHN